MKQGLGEDTTAVEKEPCRDAKGNRGLNEHLLVAPLSNKRTFRTDGLDCLGKSIP